MTIVFIGANNYDGTGTQAVRLYQHSDGYPTNVLPTIRDAMKAVRKKSADHWQHISYKFPRAEFDFLTVPINAELMAGCYIAEESSGFGMGARFEKAIYLETDIAAEWDEETRRKVYGNHGDIEWLYVVNSIERTIKVFGGGYTGDDPADTAAKGTVNPLSYVENLTEEYQDRETARIKNATRSLARYGFPVNPQRKTGRRAAIEDQRARFRNK
jgi:hypothetical protein